MFEVAPWNSGKVMETERSLFPVIRKGGIQKGFCAREPQSVLFGVNAYRFIPFKMLFSSCFIGRLLIFFLNIGLHSY